MVFTTVKDAPIRMTNEKHDASPRWSPDGKRIVFVRGGEKDANGKPKPGQLALLSLSGGESRIITDLPKGASDPVWSPDGKQIVFVSSTTPEDIQKAQSKNPAAKGGDGKPENEHESDVHVITKAVYRSNDEGYLDPRRHGHIWVMTVPSSSDELPKPVQITSGHYDEGQMIWTLDGSRIYYQTRRIDERALLRAPQHRHLFRCRRRRTPEKLATIAMGISDLALSPDGRKFAFHGSVTTPVRSYSEPDLWIMDATPGAAPQNLTANYDFDMGSSVFGDNAPPRGGHGRKLYWSPDGRSLFDLVEKQGRTSIGGVDTQKQSCH